MYKAVMSATKEEDWMVSYNLEHLKERAANTFPSNRYWFIKDANGKRVYENVPVPNIINEEAGGVPLNGPASPQTEPAPPTLATDLLERSAAHLKARASTYDVSTGERSMAKTVALFNIIQDKNPKYGMTESEGWLFMALLKIVRSETKLEPHQDSIEDFVAYASLYGEARMAGK